MVRFRPRYGLLIVAAALVEAAGGRGVLAQETTPACRIPRVDVCSFSRATPVPVPDLASAAPAWSARRSSTDPPGLRPPDRTVRPAVAFAASLALPGGGQWLQGQSRGYLYLGLEAVAWAAFAASRHHGGVLRNRYQDLAWSAARNQEAARVDPDWAYFEALSHFHSSGAWDTNPSLPGIQPETDSTTFNGSVWALARELYFPSGGTVDPGSAAYGRALDYYRAHGYPPDLTWNWSRNPPAEKQYRDLIVRSDNAFRHATIVLALVVTNHVLSAVDGFVSARFASHGNSALSRFRVDATAPAPGDPRWSLGVRLGGTP